MPIGIFNQYIYSVLMSPERFYLGSKVETLIVGDSHAAAAFNPAFIDNSINTAKAMENFFCTYYKLKIILENNPQIKQVILGFSFHNISKYHENYLFNDRNTGEVLGRYFLLFDQEGIDTIRMFSTEFVLNFFKFKWGVPFEIYKNVELFKNIFVENSLAQYPFWGKYYSSSNTNLFNELIMQKVDRYFFAGSKSYMGRSDIMKEYLYKIINLCREKNIEVYLCNTPLHFKFRKLIPDEVKIDFESLKDELELKCNNVSYLDYSFLELLENEYGDGDHVNKLGAELISSHISKYMDKKKD